MGHKSEKYVEILALTRKIQELNILFTKQSIFQERNRNKNGGKNISKNTGDNGGSSWKIIAPECGKYWTK